MFAREEQLCRASLELDAQRLLNLAPEVDLAAVERHLGTLLAICDGRPSGGPIAALQPPERFYWLVAPRSTIIQTSPIHIGRSDAPDLAEALETLMTEFVRRPASPARTGKHAARGLPD